MPSSSLPLSLPDVYVYVYVYVYVHRRAADKRIFPSLYDMSVGGASLAGEDSKLTAQWEIAEELGLSKAMLTSLTTFSNGKPFLTGLICTAYNRCLVDLFQYVMYTSNKQVAWGDFVNYSVIMASADLSMQRAVSEGTWPGPYPPIQSELQGIHQEDDSDNIKYDGNWKEWDYAPDGLLVWKAWLEFLDTERKNCQEEEQHHQQIISFEIEFGVEEGESERWSILDKIELNKLVYVRIRTNRLEYSMQLARYLLYT